MYAFIHPLLIGLLMAECGLQIFAQEPKAAQREIFVTKTADPAGWPYRYTLVREKGQWSGEVEFVQDDFSIFFCDLMKLTSAGDTLTFGALYGGPGKAFGVGWQLTLSPSPTGLDGVLIMLDTQDFKPVRLTFVQNNQAVLPSSEREGKLRAIHDSTYRTEEAFRYEVALAKEGWEKESPVAERIAQLRTDNSASKGVHKEWMGPAWVRERVTPEESKYFERICGVYLGGTAATDADVLALSQLTELRILYLHHTGITDAALAHFDRLRMLGILYLNQTKVTDEGLEKLRALPHLKRLYLLQTKITDEGVTRLRKALPDTEILWESK